MFPVLTAAQIETARRFRQRRGAALRAGRDWSSTSASASAGLARARRRRSMSSGRDGRGVEAPITVEEAGQFSGEVSQLAGRPSLAAGRAGPRGLTALPFDAAHLRALVIGSAELGEIVMRAFILRRVGLIEARRRRLRADRPARRARPRPPAGLPDAQRLSRTVLDADRRREGRDLVERLGVAADELPLDALPERHGAAIGRPNAEAARLPRHHARARSRQGLRRRRRRRRAGRARDRRLCRIRGSLGAGARPARHRRPGRRLGADRELSRLSDRHLRPGAGGRAFNQAQKFGAELAIPLEVARLDCELARDRRRRPAARADQRRDRARPDRRHRLRRALPPARTSPILRRFEGAGVSLLGLADRGASCARARRWRWSAAAIRPARRWSFSRRGEAAASDRARRRPRSLDVAISDRPHRGAAQCRAAYPDRDRRARGRRGARSDGRDVPPPRDRRERIAARCAISSSSSAPIPIPAGWTAASTTTTRASS